MVSLMGVDLSPETHRVRDYSSEADTPESMSFLRKAIQCGLPNGVDLSLETRRICDYSNQADTPIAMILLRKSM